MDIEVSDHGKTEKITSKDHLKVFEVTIDERLTWAKHINQVKSRTSNAIRNIATSSNTLSLNARKLLTDALVTPHYNYCDFIYDGCSEKAVDAFIHAAVWETGYGRGQQYVLYNAHATYINTSP